MLARFRGTVHGSIVPKLSVPRRRLSSSGDPCQGHVNKAANWLGCLFSAMYYLLSRLITNYSISMLVIRCHLAEVFQQIAPFDDRIEDKKV